MTLKELKEKAATVTAVVDQWDDADRSLVYVYLQRDYGMRIADCERALARMLFEEAGTKA